MSTPHHKTAAEQEEGGIDADVWGTASEAYQGLTSDVWAEGVEAGNIRVIARAIQAERDKTNWQPMTSAPREEGVQFLVSDSGGYMDIVELLFMEGSNPTYWNGDVVVDRSTHWQPLPAPPHPSLPEQVEQNT